MSFIPMMGEAPALAEFPLSICDIVIYMKKHIYTKKYVFGLCPSSWLRAPETLGTSWVIRVIKVSFVSHNKSLPTAPASRQSAGCWKALKDGNQP